MSGSGSFLSLSSILTVLAVIGMAGATGCTSPDDPPVSSSSGSQTDSNTASATMTGSSSGTGEEDTSGDEAEGESDDGEPSCEELECGFGVGIDNPDAMAAVDTPCVCDCDFGYINTGENGECVLDENCFQVRSLECRTSVDEGSGVGMLFGLTYCNGQPKTDLSVSDVILEEQQGEDWEELLPAESSVTIPDSAPLHHIHIVVDISDSVKAAGLLSNLQVAMEGFFDTIAAQGHPVRVAVYLFDGKYELYPLVADTADLASAKAMIANLPASVGEDSMSTNLYGAVINAIITNDRAQHKRKTASRRGLLTTGTVIIVSDGDDEAGRKTLEQVQAEMGLTSTNVITVGLGAEENYPTLSSLGRDGAFHADTPDQIASVFLDLGSRMDDFTKSTFLLGYCSPKRGETAKVRARFKDVPMLADVDQEAVCDFDATFFADGCNADVFDATTACADRECGGLVGCGTCSAGNACIDNACEPVQSKEQYPIDGECNQQVDCDPGLACIGQKCQVPAALDTSCSPGCDVPDAYCRTLPQPAVCAETFVEGSICGGDDQCLSQFCEANPNDPTDPNYHCLVPPVYRESCRAVCEAGSYCPGGASAKCERVKYDYEACTKHDECRSGNCYEFPAGGKACFPASIAFYDASI